MKKRGLALLLASFVLLLQLSAPIAQAVETDPTVSETTGDTTAPTVPVEPPAPSTPDNASVFGCHSIDAAVPLWGSDKMLKSAGAAMLFEAKSDTVMYAYNPDMPMYPASLAKLMTALLAIENCDSQETVTVTARAMVSLPANSDTIKLKVGESFTMEQMLYALLVGSANDAAVVIAEHVSGSVSKFVTAMNERAAELGCTDTVFMNPHGLHDARQVTTARDMVRLVDFAMENEQFMTYFAATNYNIPATTQSEIRYLASTNYLMTPSKDIYYDSRVTGGRTGVTDSRERCLIATAESNGLTYIAVVLGATPTFEADGVSIKRFGSYEEVGELFDKGFDGYQKRQILYEGQILTQFDVIDGQNKLAAGPSAAVFSVLPTKVTNADLTIRYTNPISNIQAPVASGEVLATVEVWYESVCIATSPLVARHDVQPYAQGPQKADKQFDASGLWVWILLALLFLPVVIILVAGLALVILRYSRISAMNKRMKRRKVVKRRRR